MKRKVFAGLAVILLTTTLTWAQQGPHRKRGFERSNRPDMTEKLNLTDDQQTKMDALRTEHFQSTQELRDQLREKQVKLDGLLNDREINSKEVEKLISEIGKNQTELMQLRIDHRIEIRKLLTDEQKVKFDMMHHHRDFRHPGRNG